MKGLVTIVRIIVGLLFIFSGLVKANDPLGLSYKMQEFFEVWGVHGLNNFTLAMSVLMNAFEIIAGFALLLGWRIKIFIWLLLLLIVFFTFLTGYTVITGKPKNCGCFGDCLPITAFTSFMKDVVLLILIGFLLWKKEHIKPIFKEKAGIALMILVSIFSFGFQWYTLNYLPVVDCLPFKKESSIIEKRKMPVNAIPDSTVITFVYKKAGKEIEFTADKFPADFNKDTYEFVKRYDKLIRPGKNNEPPIKGFNLTGISGTDSTDIVLNQPYALMLIAEKLPSGGNWIKEFEALYKTAKEKNILSYIITSQPEETARLVAKTGFSDVQVFTCDYKAIQTASRANMCIYLLKSGMVVNKFSGKQMGKLKSDLDKVPVQEKKLLLQQTNSGDSIINADTVISNPKQ